MRVRRIITNVREKVMNGDLTTKQPFVIRDSKHGPLTVDPSTITLSKSAGSGLEIATLRGKLPGGNEVTVVYAKSAVDKARAQQALPVDMVSQFADEEFVRKSAAQPIYLFAFPSPSAQFGPFKGMKGHCWLYQDSLYEVQGELSVDEMRLLVLESADRDRQMFERLRLKYESESAQEVAYNRPRIPEEVRVAVWRRDQGKCARCGSRENLEYDHIIPISKGGSNTLRNIELLCEQCNREKGVQIQ